MPPGPIGLLNNSQTVELIMRGRRAKKCGRPAVTFIESFAAVINSGELILAPGAIKIQAAAGHGYACHGRLSGRPGDRLAELRYRNRGVENISAVLQRPESERRCSRERILIW